MKNIKIKDEYIKLGQAMKLAGLVSEGFEAKLIIADGKVKVGGEVCTQRGKKLYEGDVFSFEGEDYVVVHS
ncbi:MAG: RNA-binding S4 domain-containing protein [Lachnospiraceae bacterium]|jgi:ribosome-associated protein|nr:RNA-binding S4 domain-containing protein [Lachnospiraceae bacterium]